jgi:predicted lactoylglutathione lyase
VTKPFDGNAATVGNGVMVALAMDSRDKVDALYRKAMELGAKDEGAPGPRSDDFYAGHFRDPDGNKLNAFFMGWREWLTILVTAEAQHLYRRRLSSEWS